VELVEYSGLLKSKLETETVVELLQLNTSEAAAAATGAMDHQEVYLVQKQSKKKQHRMCRCIKRHHDITHSLHIQWVFFLFLFFFPNF
jgi:hypothetical protein